MTASINPTPSAAKYGGGCGHWFYWIAAVTRIAYCQDCPHAWPLTQARPTGAGVVDPSSPEVGHGHPRLGGFADRVEGAR